MSWLLSKLSVPLLLKVILILVGCLGICGVWISIQTGSIAKAKAKHLELEARIRVEQEAHLSLIQRVNDERKKTEQEFQKILDDALALRPQETKTITRIIEKTVNENPGFARCERSPALHDERVRQLEAIRKAVSD